MELRHSTEGAMPYTYSNNADRNNPHKLPNVEVFYLSAAEACELPTEGGAIALEHGGEGWYWWACFPGCLPDGAPSGPFSSHGAALNDACDTTEPDYVWDHAEEAE